VRRHSRGEVRRSYRFLEVTSTRDPPDEEHEEEEEEEEEEEGRRGRGGREEEKETDELKNKRTWKEFNLFVSSVGIICEREC
jgi:hypothetical protein